jgi:hypothetical protein
MRYALALMSLYLLHTCGAQVLVAHLNIYSYLYVMMLREIIKPTKASFTMRLPEEMVGKTVEIIAFEVNSETSLSTKAQRLAEIEELTKSSLIDLTGFKFDRDSANDYNE